MVGWHHRLNGHEFEQAPGDGEGQGSLACRSPRGRKESDTTEWLNNRVSLADSTFFYIAVQDLDALSVILKGNPTAGSLSLLNSSVFLLAHACLQWELVSVKQLLLRAALVVWWLILPLSMLELQVQSLAGGLRSCMTHGKKTENIKQMHHGNKFNKDF